MYGVYILSCATSRPKNLSRQGIVFKLRENILFKIHVIKISQYKQEFNWSCVWLGKNSLQWKQVFSVIFFHRNEMLYVCLIGIRNDEIKCVTFWYAADLYQNVENNLKEITIFSFVILIKHTLHFTLIWIHRQHLQVIKHTA